MIKRQNALLLAGLAVIGLGADLAFQAVFPAVAAESCPHSELEPQAGIEWRWLPFPGQYCRTTIRDPDGSTHIRVRHIYLS